MGATYSETQQRSGQRAMIVEGVFSRAMEGVTGGVLLAAFALSLGASDAAIGVLAAIPFLAQLAHLPAVALLDRFRDRKPVAIWAGAAARSLFFVIALVPLLPASAPRLPIVVGVLVAYATIATFAGAAWQVWVRDLVPRERLGAYFGRRMGILSGVGLVTLLAAGQYLAWWRGRFPESALVGFSVLFAAGAVSGFVSLLVLSRAPSTAIPVPRRARGLQEAIALPFRERNYRRVLVFLGAWGFAANLALPFLSVVLLRGLGYTLDVVTALAALSLVANAVGFKAWAPLTDRFGNKPVLFLSAALFLVAIASWAMLPDEAGPGVLAAAAVLHVVLGLATSGLDLASNGLVLKLAPDDDAPAFLASASLVKAIATGVAPLLGGLAAMVLAGRSFTVRLAWATPEGESVVNALRFSHYDFLFLASAAVGLYSIHRLLGFEEAGEAPPDAVVRAVRREVLQVSSVAGMRSFAHLGSYVSEVAFRFDGDRRLRRRAPSAPPDRIETEPSP